jgi:hypothetical protein
MPLISTSAIVHPNPNGAIDGLLPEDNGLMKIVGGLSLYLLLVGLQIGQLSGKCRDPFHTGGRKDFRRGPSIETVNSSKESSSLRLAPTACYVLLS